MATNDAAFGPAMLLASSGLGAAVAAARLGIEADRKPEREPTAYAYVIREFGGVSRIEATLSRERVEPLVVEVWPEEVADDKSRADLHTVLERLFLQSDKGLAADNLGEWPLPVGSFGLILHVIELR
jgi:hypothetical protein